jgi:hypothetical protein
VDAPAIGLRFLANISGRATKVSAIVLKVVSQSASRLRINSAAVTAMPKLANHVILLVI